MLQNQVLDQTDRVIADIGEGKSKVSYASYEIISGESVWRWLQCCPKKIDLTNAFPAEKWSSLWRNLFPQ
jgi:hypothetical protein